MDTAYNVVHIDCRFTVPVFALTISLVCYVTESTVVLKNFSSRDEILKLSNARVNLESKETNEENLNNLNYVIYNYQGDMIRVVKILVVGFF